MKAGENPELEAAAALVEGRYRKQAGRRADETLLWLRWPRRGFAYPVIKEAIKRAEGDD